MAPPECRRVGFLESPVTSLCISSGTLFCSLENGNIVSTTIAPIEIFVNGTPQFSVVFRLDSEIDSIDSDSSGNLLIADSRRQNISKLCTGSGNLHLDPLITEYEENQLLGPTSVCFCSKTGSIFFTDSGSRGESGLHRNRGSILYSNENNMLISISGRVLFDPVSCSLSNDGLVLFVAEKAKNRILRYTQDPKTKIWSGCVFLQLSGRQGPVSVVQSDSGLIYIAHFERSHFAANGKITVADCEGNIISSFDDLPGAEIAAMVLSSNQKFLFVAERSTKGLFVYELN